MSAKKAPEIIRTIAIFWQGSCRLSQTTNQYACLAITIAFSAKRYMKRRKYLGNYPAQPVWNEVYEGS
ncbi:MAG: hypothetical protein ACJA0O_001003 [Porticoccus sp.]|jgi:hypothetical protein